MHRCNVSKLLTRVLELAGGLMEEFAIPSGPRKELINNHCSEFMQLIKLDIQVTLREEIKSACKYRPFEKCDYITRISNEICCKKVEYVIEKCNSTPSTSQGGALFTHLDTVGRKALW
ncbi:putative mediator complex, subunit Med11 [Helianthus annuus]|nr:putative mediator complex, subunit Med11 [Helianthus annuus]